LLRRFAQPPGAQVQVGEVLARVGEIGRQLHHALQQLLGVGDARAPAEQHAQVVERVDAVAVELEGLQVQHLGVVETALLDTHVAEVVAVHRLARPQLDRARDRCRRRVEPPLLRLQHAVQMQRIGIVGVAGQLLPVQRLGPIEAARAVFGHRLSEHRVFAGR